MYTANFAHTRCKQGEKRVKVLVLCRKSDNFAHLNVMFYPPSPAH